jgi:hypothetical protein
MVRSENESTGEYIGVGHPIDPDPTDEEKAEDQEKSGNLREHQ